MLNRQRLTADFMDFSPSCLDFDSPIKAGTPVRGLSDTSVWRDCLLGGEMKDHFGEVDKAQRGGWLLKGMASIVTSWPCPTCPVWPL